jgi:uncharacterized protein YqjF (DUF2071 family)
VTPIPVPDRPAGWPFLTARWTNLFLATYAVPDELLLKRVPPGLELDRRDGQPFVSLVAFDFLDTRVLGVPWPGFRHFPEFNLRFYVRRGAERGVVFVREFVPQRFVAWVARVLYNEPYAAMPGMASNVTETDDAITVEHWLPWQGRTNRVRATGAKPGSTPDASSVEHFFKEHYWGWGTTRGRRVSRYQVWHPVWEVYPVRDYLVDVDWAALYGPEWAVLQGTVPHSTVLAAGSEIAVYPKGVLPPPAADCL